MNPITGAFIAIAVGLIGHIVIALVQFGSFKRLFREYPPHRHENGMTIYSPDYPPGQVVKMQEQR